MKVSNGENSSLIGQNVGRESTSFLTFFAFNGSMNRLNAAKYRLYRSSSFRAVTGMLADGLQVKMASAYFSEVIAFEISAQCMLLHQDVSIQWGVPPSVGMER